MANRSRKSKLKLTTPALVAVSVAVVLLAIAAAFFVRHAITDTKQTANGTSHSVAGGAQYSTTPLSSKDVNSSNDTRKSSSGGVSPTLNSSGKSQSSASVTITRVSANPSKVFTLVSGATGGTCELNATASGEQTVSAQSQVELSTNNYQCGDFGLANSQFSTGHWHIIVTLTSGDASVQSEAWDT